MLNMFGSLHCLAYLPMLSKRARLLVLRLLRLTSAALATPHLKHEGSFLVVVVVVVVVVLVVFVVARVVVVHLVVGWVVFVVVVVGSR